MTYALRDKRTGEIAVLRATNPLCYLTEEELKSGEYLPDHIERIEVKITETSSNEKKD